MRSSCILFFWLGLSIVAWAGVTPTWEWRLSDSLPHQRSHFTQGLSWVGDTLLESTGLVGRSAVYRYDRKGRLLDSMALPAQVFGEGSVQVGNQIHVLTWRDGKYYIIDATKMRILKELTWNGEGWGITYGRGGLWWSDGSDQIFQRNLLSGELMGVIQVRDGFRPIHQLNELEWVGSVILANVWYSDSIAVIEPSTGRVQAWLDLSRLARRIRRDFPATDVLNGIAWDGNKLWITGKLWPFIYALQVPALTDLIRANANGIPKRSLQKNPK